MRAALQAQQAADLSNHLNLNRTTSQQIQQGQQQQQRQQQQIVMLSEVSQPCNLPASLTACLPACLPDSLPDSLTACLYSRASGAHFQFSRACSGIPIMLPVPPCALPRPSPAGAAPGLYGSEGPEAQVCRSRE